MQNLKLKPEREEDRELSFTRIFEAPRDLVWKMWTDPQMIVQWWGPTGFTTTNASMEVKAGGVWKYVMHGPDGRDYDNVVVYQEVVKPERLVYQHGDSLERNDETFDVTITFEAQDNKTKLTMRSLFPTAQQRDKVIKEYGAEEGANQTLSRLGEQLAKEPIVIERTFNAPASAVWKAITDLDSMKQWYMGTLESFKSEVGFETKFNVHHNGRDFMHLWKVMEVVPEKKIAYDWRYADAPGNSTVTFELVAEGGKTRLKLTHTGLESFKPEAHPEYARSNFLQGWTSLITSKLETFLT